MKRPSVIDATLSRLRDGERWMADQLRLGLPESVLTVLWGEGRRIVLSTEGTMRRCRLLSRLGQVDAELEYSAHGGGPLAPANMMALVRKGKGVPVLLEATAVQILRQRIELPRLSHRQIRAAVRNGIGIWTPFKADDVFFASVWEKKDLHRLIVDIHYVPKRVVADDIEQWQRDGWRIDQILLPNGMTVFIDDDARKRIRLPIRVDRGLVVVAALLTAACLGALIWQTAGRRDAAERMIRQELAALRRQAVLEEERRSLIAQHALPAEASSEAIRITRILDRLAKQLPANASILSFEWADGKGRFEIDSGSATAMAPKSDDIVMLEPASMGGLPGGRTAFLIRLRPGTQP